MNVETLLKELDGSDPFSAIISFNKTVEESNNAQGIIIGLLLASNECNEILKLLMVEKRTSFEICAIFSTLGHILINIAGELKEFSGVGLHITRQLLHNHEAHIYKFLQPANTNNNTKAVLRCITGMVLLGGVAAIEVLENLKWSEINLSLLVSRQSLRDVWDVRAWCIYLMMAFLNSMETPFVVRQFVQKKDILPVIFPGLMWDPCERVINVLKVMRESILLNPTISKTIKVNLFNNTSGNSLFLLYNWVGPMGKLVKNANTEAENEIAKTIEKERAQVRVELQKFMLTLCASSKHGIVFREKSKEGDRAASNSFMLKMISNLPCPWEIPEGRELVSHILATCPSLFKKYVVTLEKSLELRHSASFLSLIDMLIQIIDCQSPWLMLETKGYAGIMSGLLPSSFNNALFKSLLKSPHQSIRHSGMLLLYSILSKLKETGEHILESSAVSVSGKESIRQRLTKNMFERLIPINDVMTCWKTATDQETILANKATEEVAIPGKRRIKVAPPLLSQLLTIAKVISLYAELQPSQNMYETISPMELLNSLCCIPDKNSETSKCKTKVELQVICLGLLACSKLSQDLIVDSSETEEPGKQQVEKNVLYQLISIHSESKEFSSEDEDGKLMLSVTEKCQNILSTVLSNVGLPTCYDGNVKFWLKHIPSNNIAKISSFLVQVIKKTASSLSQYTDQLVEVSSRFTHSSNFLAETDSIMSLIESVEVVDNEDISPQAVSLPFSRLILGAMNILNANKDTECIEYFSLVMNDYIYSLSLPGLLVDYLLQEESIITSDLQDHFRCWHKKDHQSSKKDLQLSDNPGLSEICKYLFMTHDWSSVEDYLEGNRLLDAVDRVNLDLVVTQLLIYVCLESESKKKGNKMIKNYGSLLKKVYHVFNENGEKKYAECVLETILSHPKITLLYQPFSTKESSITEMIQDCIELVLLKHPTIAPTTAHYFKVLKMNFQNHLSRKGKAVDVLRPFAPYITSESTVVSYEDLEKLFMTCLGAVSSGQPSLSKLLHGIVQLLLKTTSAKRKLTTRTVEHTIATFLDLGRTEDSSAEHEALMTDFEKLLIISMDAGNAEQLSTEDVKSLLQCQPPCPELCCHLVKQYPPHCRSFARYLKKYSVILPAQAPLLAYLLPLGQEELGKGAESALRKVSGSLETWLLDFEAEDDETQQLIPIALQRDILDAECLSSICQKLYEETVKKENPPPKRIFSLLPVFKRLAETEPQLSKLGLPDENMALLEICLSCIQSMYQKNMDQSNLLTDISHLAVDMLPQIDGCLLQKNLINNSLWEAYVKKVLRRSLNNKTLGPDMVDLLRQLCCVVYQEEGRRRGKFKEEEGVFQREPMEEGILPLTTLYKMIMGHTQYLTLMFNREEEWEPLKESVVRLQQSLVEISVAVCQEVHVTVLLGAYGASMSSVDQCILKLMHKYEIEGHMRKLQPVLWGDVAVAHFGIKSQTAGFFRDPTTDQIMGLLDIERLKHTCRNFNYSLPLEPTQIGAVDRTVYDIRFLIPLLLLLGRDTGNGLTEIDYAESGAVILGFTALTSYQEDVWGAGAALLRCMVRRMERSRHIRLKLVWQWMVGVVSCAMESKRRRLPSITSHFLVQATLLLSQPAHPMYHPVLHYLFLGPEFRLYKVPDIYTFFSSSHLTDHRDHCSFLLTNLSEGIRDNRDYKLCRRTFTPTLMIGMLQSPTADTELKVQVLEVLESMARLKLGAFELVSTHNLLALLPLVALPNVNAPGFRNYTPGLPLLMTGIVRILIALWNTLMSTLKPVNEAPDDDEPAYEEDEQEELEYQQGDDDYEMMGEGQGWEDEGERKWKRSREEEEYVDEGKSKKRRHGGETYSKAFKKSALERVASETDVDTQILENKNSASSTKMLPPLCVQEFLNCLKLLAPSILSKASVATSAQLLNLLADIVEYVEVIALLTADKFKFRIIALTPELIRQQVYGHINWAELHQQLAGHLSDDEEVLLLGAQAEGKQEEWRREPLRTCLGKQIRSVDSSQDQEEHERTKNQCDLNVAVIRLLKVLRR